MDTEGSNPLGLCGYREAATALKVEESWLRRHIKKLPHAKLGGRILFTESDLRCIVSMFHHDPGAAPQGTVGSIAKTHPLSALQPLPRSATKRAS